MICRSCCFRLTDLNLAKQRTRESATRDTPIHSAANARVVEVLLRRGPPRTFAEWEVAGQLSVDHTNGEGGHAG